MCRKRWLTPPLLLLPISLQMKKLRKMQTFIFPKWERIIYMQIIRFFVGDEYFLYAIEPIEITVVE